MEDLFKRLGGKRAEAKQVFINEDNLAQSSTILSNPACCVKHHHANIPAFVWPWPENATPVICPTLPGSNLGFLGYSFLGSPQLACDFATGMSRCYWSHIYIMHIHSPSSIVTGPFPKGQTTEKALVCLLEVLRIVIMYSDRLMGHTGRWLIACSFGR